MSPNPLHSLKKFDSRYLITDILLKLAFNKEKHFLNSKKLYDMKLNSLCLENESNLKEKKN